MDPRISFLVAHYQLVPHPEGGFFRETYRSPESLPETALPARFGGARQYATAIYFLLTAGNFSAFHRIKSDECWHFYTGHPLWVHVIHPDGKYERLVLGSDPSAGEHFQAVVPAGCWFASETAPGGVFSLVGCTVAPGFDFNDFELAEAHALASEFPSFEKLVYRLCR